MAKQPRGRREKYRVFLSHSHQDEWISAVMAEKIRAMGVEVWLDVFDLPGGAPIKEQIKEAVLACDECLILVSPASLASDWVMHEASLADAFNKWITLILLHVTEAAMPATWKDLKLISINEFPGYLQHLRERAQHHV
jgi:hypothetical protein